MTPTSETAKFVDQEYVISESTTITITYDATGLFTTDAVVYCGIPTIQFIKDGTSGDTTIIYTEDKSDLFTEN